MSRIKEQYGLIISIWKTSVIYIGESRNHVHI